LMVVSMAGRDRRARWRLVRRCLRGLMVSLVVYATSACADVDAPAPGPPIALIDVGEGGRPLLIGDDGAVTNGAEPLPWFRHAIDPVGDSALLVLGMDEMQPDRLMMIRLPRGELLRSVSTAGLLTEWMGCEVNATHPRYAAVTGSPVFVALAGVPVCGIWGLVGLSWPDARVTGIIQDLEVDYWALAALPGDSPLVAAGGRRGSDPEGVGRLYVVNTRTMTIVDSSAPIAVAPAHHTPWVEVAWTDDPDRGYVLTSDARIRLYRRSTGAFTPVAANAVESRIRFDHRRNAVLVFIDWPGVPTLQWFTDSGEVFPRVSLAGMMPDGSDPVIRDVRPGESGELLVLTGTNGVNPDYPPQTCRVFRVNDTAAAGVNVSLLAATDAYGCSTLVPLRPS
jgi:hypothetical protein